MGETPRDIIPIMYDSEEKACIDRYIIKPERDGLFVLHEAKNVIDVNYLDFAERLYFETAYLRRLLLVQNMFKGTDIPQDIIDACLRKQIIEDYRSWDEQQILQPFLVQLLTTDANKKAQINILKGKSLTSQQLHAFFRESARLGFTYSQYFFTRFPNGYVKDQVPSFAYLHRDGKVEKYGTTISDKAVKNLIKEQQRTFVRFATKGEQWHCMISDLSGITGRENGKKFGGVSHIHYLSDKFGIDKDSLIEELQNHHHPSFAFHLRLNK